MANDDLEWSAHLEEYKNLTDEIKRRVSYQLLILGGNITFISAVIGTFSDNFDADHLTMILLLPLVSFVIGWLFFEQDVFVTQPARYLHQALRPALLRCIAKRTDGQAEDLSKVMAWEAFRNKLLFDPGSSYHGFFRLMVLFRWFATIGPGLALLVAAAYITWRSPGGLYAVTLLQWFLFTIDIIGVIFGFVIHRRVDRFYREIPG
jgi:hypothetical protein